MTLERDEIGSGAVTTNHIFSCPGRGGARVLPGPIYFFLLCMGLFSRFWVPAPRCTAHSVSKTRVNVLMGVAPWAPDTSLLHRLRRHLGRHLRFLHDRFGT